MSESMIMILLAFATMYVLIGCILHVSRQPNVNQWCQKYGKSPYHDGDKFMWFDEQFYDTEEHNLPSHIISEMDGFGTYIKHFTTKEHAMEALRKALVDVGEIRA